ncbi:tRNA 2-selenouridine(34) synthase MnmH [Heyndrickxia acidicola]|uniref:tRNA 2-selenouridine(34) synthase MnmH n=1 Tax=Heyndrickxia acidicola TaxID=209389 RepID=A0ABU6MH66_9BACI|nr:tRNA 2-selenouridine(34) synthase MnmH [Heyndrickxia acidicola]MED1204016.1 tRNA 2-selenouridine(34) synthase MnmH [Heyndrickxia acidicola]
MFQDITIDELLVRQKKKDLVLIDVRSPSEYRDSTIPGSINIPVFNDEERAEVGTIYKQVSSEAAKERGLEIFSAKLPAFIKEFKKYEGDKVVFCWRGGMRSKTAATVLALMGIHANRIQGGVRAYRKWVVETLKDFPFTPTAYVLNGYTGIGKTKILKSLEQEGYPVLDLEEMAGHRGSIFGQIGLKPNNQKTFDSLVLEKALRIKDSSFVLFEAESKRIGKVVMPEFLIEKKEYGIQIFIEMPIEERIKHILEDYAPWEHQKECQEAFSHIKNRLHTPIAKEIEIHLQSGDFYSAVELLLTYYYDPRYHHTAIQFPEERRLMIQVENAEEAAVKIKGIIEKAAMQKK